MQKVNSSYLTLKADIFAERALPKKSNIFHGIDELDTYYERRIRQIESLKVYSIERRFDLQETVRLKRGEVNDLRMIPTGVTITVDDKTGKVKMMVDGREYMPRH